MTTKPLSDNSKPISDNSSVSIKPFFSVLIASTGNDCLYQALHSIVDAQDDDYEVVLILDNPNFTPEQLDAHRIPEQMGEKLKVFYNEKQLGLTLSLNKGLQECSGVIICRLDDDDCFLPNRFSSVREFVKKQPDVAVFTGGGLVKDHKGRQHQHSIPEDHQDIVNDLSRRNILIHSALNIKSETIRLFGGYNNDYYYAQDYELYLRLIRNGVRFYGIQQEIVERTEGNESITISKRKNQALYSFSALALHHARLWGTLDHSLMHITRAFIRFITPQFFRRIVRRLRSLRKVVRL